MMARDHAVPSLVLCPRRRAGRACFPRSDKPTDGYGRSIARASAASSSRLGKPELVPRRVTLRLAAATAQRTAATRGRPRSTAAATTPASTSPAPVVSTAITGRSRHAAGVPDAFVHQRTFRPEGQDDLAGAAAAQRRGGRVDLDLSGQRLRFDPVQDRDVHERPEACVVEGDRRRVQDGRRPGRPRPVQEPCRSRPG